MVAGYRLPPSGEGPGHQTKVLVDHFAQEFARSNPGWRISNAARAMLAALLAGIHNETYLFGPRAISGDLDMTSTAIDLLPEFFDHLKREREIRGASGGGHQPDDIGPVQVVLALQPFLARRCLCPPQ